jgi:tetratricopeptide (TPR) repeat protein
MKPILTLIFLNLMISSALAQNVSLQQTDSLKHQLSIATKDTTQVLILSELCEAYRSSKPDSALLYGQQALIRARQINFSRGEVHALLSISVVQRELGNLPAALAMALKALKIAEDKHYNYEEINSLVRTANVYFASKDLPKALSYFKQAEKKLETIPGVILGGALLNC